MRTSWLPAKTLSILLPALVLLATVPPALAQDHRDASVGFYLEEANKYPVCSQLEPPSCADGDVPVTGELYVGYYAFLCVFNGNAQLGIAGLQCAIEFDDATRSGVDFDSWNACSAVLEFPQDGWAQVAGAGNTITWDYKANCQREEPGGFGTGVTTVAGFFYLTAYSEDLLKVVPFRGTASGSSMPALKVIDCGDGESSGAETTLANDHGGSLGFSDDGSVVGNLPCVQRVQEETTWGGVKDLYNNR